MKCIAMRSWRRLVLAAVLLVGGTGVPGMAAETNKIVASGAPPVVKAVAGAEGKAATNTAATGSLDNLPAIIFDESSGDWVVDRFAGNSTCGFRLYQGPAREVGGLGRIKEAVATPDGSVYLVAGGNESVVTPLLKVTPDGMLRLMMGKKGLIEGPMEQCQAGRPIWNPKETLLYLTGPNCLRRIVEKPDGTRWVEVVAGVPNKAGKQDGPAKEATFQSRYRGIVCNSAGVFFWLEDNGLRRIENGTVSSVPLKHLDEPKRFSFAMGGGYHGLLNTGENDDTLYISDYYGYHNFRILRCDLKNGDLIRVCGMKGAMKDWKNPTTLEKRYGANSDGPALTHASANSGLIGVYDPFHKAIWVHGPDEGRFRWLRLDGDGWVRTVFGASKPGTKQAKVDDNGLGIPGDQYQSMWNAVCGVDSKGGVFVAQGRNQTGVWRAYNKREVKP